jgi:uncharacterized protein (TIGR02594 family)
VIPWLAIARRYLGLAEIPGREHNPTIVRWLRDLRAWWSEDETPWCGTYCAAVMREAGIEPPKHWYRALAWLDFGTPLMLPQVGCIVVFDRKGGGHVGFVVGEDEQMRLMVLGGNQGNRISIAPFDRSRVRGYRWPDKTLHSVAPLPRLASNGQPVSSNEA